MSRHRRIWLIEWDVKDAWVTRIPAVGYVSACVGAALARSPHDRRGRLVLPRTAVPANIPPTENTPPLLG